MFKLWAKEFDEDNKITLNKTFEFKQDFDVRLLHAYVEVICNELKTETPIFLMNHYVNFNNFNRVQFSKSDFVDEVDFKTLSIELIS